MSGTQCADDDLVTILVPARNEEHFIGVCLESILAQDRDNLQVIVVDGASDDATAEVVRAIAARDPRVELLHNPDRIIPKALNLGLAAARGRWLVRIDAHATIPTDYVGRVVEHLRSGRWGGVGGRKDGVGVTPAGRAIAAAMGSPFGVGNSTYHYGERTQTTEHIPFGAYPTELVRSLGGWDERFRVNQDFEFDYRVREAGYELLFDPALVIRWHCRQSVPELFRQYRRYGAGKARVGAAHPPSLRLRHLVAPALVAWMAVWSLVALRRPRWAAAAMCPYGAGLAAASVTVGRQVDRRARPWLPAAFASMHVGWGLGFWEGAWKVASSTVVKPKDSPPGSG